MESDTAGRERVVEARRRGGKLYRINTSRGRSFLVVRDPATKRFLEVGAPVRSEDLELLEGPQARRAGLALAYRLISRRDRTEREIRSALREEGVTSPEVVEDVVSSLRGQGYLDDRRLASNLINYLAEHKPSGPHLLRRKLRELGVGDEVAAAELRSAMPPDREREIAEGLARRKLKGIVGRERAVRRVHGLLSRRGFRGCVVNDICARILRGEIVGEEDGRKELEGS